MLLLIAYSKGHRHSQIHPKSHQVVDWFLHFFKLSLQLSLSWRLTYSAPAGSRGRGGAGTRAGGGAGTRDGGGAGPRAAGGAGGAQHYT